MFMMKTVYAVFFFVSPGCNIQTGERSHFCLLSGSSPGENKNDDFSNSYLMMISMVLVSIIMNQSYRLSQVHQFCKLVLIEVAVLTAVVIINSLSRI